jgi:hypothetical protein
VARSTRAIGRDGDIGAGAQHLHTLQQCASAASRRRSAYAEESETSYDLRDDLAVAMFADQDARRLPVRPQDRQHLSMPQREHHARITALTPQECLTAVDAHAPRAPEQPDEPTAQPNDPSRFRIEWRCRTTTVAFRRRFARATRRFDLVAHEAPVPLIISVCHQGHALCGTRRAQPAAYVGQSDEAATRTGLDRSSSGSNDPPRAMV